MDHQEQQRTVQHRLAVLRSAFPRIDAAEFDRMLDGIVINDTELFNDELRE